MDMYAALEELMGSTIRGTFYPSELRPIEANTEDAVLTCSNATAGQIQEGRARLNIYVPPSLHNSTINRRASKELPARLS